MQKFLSVVCFIITINTECFSQTPDGNGKLEDVVYLRDGSMFRGVIKELIADSLVKIEIVGGNLMVIPQKEIDHIDYHIRQESRTIKTDLDSCPPAPRDHGYFNTSELGIMPGANYSDGYYGYGNQSPVGFTIQTINGYRFNSNFLVGGGLGMDIIQQAMLQFFADARWEMLHRRATPFLYVDIGYGIPVSKEPQSDYFQTTYKGGLMWGSGVGMRFNFHREGAFLVGVGYKMDKRSEEVVSEGWPYDSKYDYTFNRLVMKFGLSF